MNFVLILSVTVFGLCWCQDPTVMSTTKHHHTHHTHAHHSHATHEPPEKEAYTFQYSPATHKMYIRKGHLCYICTLSAQERIDVHSDGGITALENQLTAALKLGQVYTDDVNSDQYDPSRVDTC